MTTIAAANNHPAHDITPATGHPNQPMNVALSS